MKGADIMSTWREALVERREDRNAHLQLEREIADYRTPAERLEIQSILARYPPEDTQEIRRMLVRQVHQRRSHH